MNIKEAYYWTSRALTALYKQDTEEGIRYLEWALRELRKEE